MSGRLIPDPDSLRSKSEGEKKNGAEAPYTNLDIQTNIEKVVSQ